MVWVKQDGCIWQGTMRPTCLAGYSKVDHYDHKEEAGMGQEEHEVDPGWTKMGTRRRQRQAILATRRKTGRAMIMRRSS